MFCCLDWGSNSQRGSPFPGHRGGNGGYYPTGGNALSAQDYQGQGAVETVGVTVPPGTSGGDQIKVSSPSGNIVSAIIPHGMNPGDTFIVEVPRNNNNNNSMNMNQNYNNNYNCNTQSPIIPSAPPKEQEISVGPITTQADPIPPVPVPVEATVVPDSRQDATTTTSTRINNTYDNNSSNQKLMLVQVPPFTAPGDTINVQVPGENRMISAQVPPGVTQFHVAYTPMQQSQQQQHPVIMGRPVNSNNCNYNNAGSYGNNYNNNGNYGFNNNNYNNNNNRFGNRFGNNGGYRPYNNYNNGYDSNNYNNGYGRNNNNGGGGMGLAAPLLAGAALVGGAGYLMHQHNHHQHDAEDYDNGGGGYDAGGGDGENYDAGGGDAGDYDAGGYDDGGGDGGDFGGGDY